MFSSWGRHAGKILQGPREGVIQDTYIQYFLEVVRQLRRQQIGKKSGTIRLDVILSLILKYTVALELQNHFTKSPREIQECRRHSWRSKERFFGPWFCAFLTRFGKDLVRSLIRKADSWLRDFVLFWQGFKQNLIRKLQNNLHHLVWFLWFWDRMRCRSGIWERSA